MAQAAHSAAASPHLPFSPGNSFASSSPTMANGPNVTDHPLPPTSFPTSPVPREILLGQNFGNFIGAMCGASWMARASVVKAGHADGHPWLSSGQELWLIQAAHEMVMKNLAERSPSLFEEHRGAERAESVSSRASSPGPQRDELELDDDRVENLISSINDFSFRDDEQCWSQSPFFSTYHTYYQVEDEEFRGRKSAPSLPSNKAGPRLDALGLYVDNTSERKSGADTHSKIEASTTAPQVVLPSKSSEAVVAVSNSANTNTRADSNGDVTRKAEDAPNTENSEVPTAPLPAPAAVLPVSKLVEHLNAEVNITAHSSNSSASNVPAVSQLPSTAPVASQDAVDIANPHMVDTAAGSNVEEPQEIVASMEDVKETRALQLMDDVEATPLGMDDVEETPLAMDDVKETPLAMDDVQETPLGMDDVEATPLTMDDVEETPLGMDDITVTTSTALGTPSTPTNNTTTTAEASAPAADAMDERQDSEGVPVINIEPPTTSTYPVPSQQFSTLPSNTNTNATASSSRNPFPTSAPVNQAPARIPQWRLSEFQQFSTRRREGLRSIWADKGFDNGDEFVDAYVEDEQQLEDNEDDEDEYDEDEEEEYYEDDEEEEEEYSEHVSFLDDLEAAFLEEAEEEEAAAVAAAADVDEEL